jgi:hypothetical protein
MGGGGERSILLASIYFGLCPDTMIIWGPQIMLARYHLITENMTTTTSASKMRAMK